MEACVRLKLVSDKAAQRGEDEALAGCAALLIHYSSHPLALACCLDSIYKQWCERRFDCAFELGLHVLGTCAVDRM